MRVKVRTKVKVNIDVAAKMQRSAEAAAKIVFSELNSAFLDAMGSKVWEWPRTTIRKGAYKKDGTRGKGFVVTSPRNIVDLGTLRASNDFAISGTLCTFRFTAAYATAVHYGARIHPFGDKSRPLVDLPARPWMDAVLGRVRVSGITPYDVQGEFKNYFNNAWRMGK